MRLNRLIIKKYCSINYHNIFRRFLAYTLRAESFAGRKFREDGKSRNFANLTFANNNFRLNFTDKTFANPPNTLLLGEKLSRMTMNEEIFFELF